MAVRQGLQQDIQDSFSRAAQRAAPLVQEAYTDTNAVAKEARRRGHAAGAALAVGAAAAGCSSLGEAGWLCPGAAMLAGQGQ